MASTDNTNPGQNEQAVSSLSPPVDPPPPEKGWLRRLSENALAILIGTVISTGLVSTVITLVIQHHYDEKLHSHELKLERYMSLIDELSKLTAQQPDWDKLRLQLNAALCFSSDEVAAQILLLNNELTPIFEAIREDRKQGKDNPHLLPGEKIKPLILAIREDLFLSSDKLEGMDLRFFIKAAPSVSSDSKKEQAREEAG